MLKTDWFKDGWMQTYTGRKFYPQTPEPGMIDIRDIAHGLSLTCRFGGQCDGFYSVAQHCVVMLHYAQCSHFHDHPAKGLTTKELKILQRDVLMHDATEAYLGDMPSPVKALLPDFKRMEDKLDVVIRRTFDLPEEKHPLVKVLDTGLVVTELRVLCGPRPADALIEVPELPGIDYIADEVAPAWKPKVAERNFLNAYKRLFT